MRGVLNAALLLTMVGLGNAALAVSPAAADELQEGSIVTVSGTAGEGLRVRSDSGTASRVLTTIKEGQRLEILDGPVKANDLDWYKVKANGVTGWSNGKYLVPVERAPKSASPNSSELGATSTDASRGPRTFVSSTTGYATGNKGVGTRTATGTQVRWGIVSVDPSVIPFGSQLVIDGFEGGLFTAEDRGSAIKGTHVDIFFPEQAAAGKYGTQQRRVTVIREGYGR
ncbi:MAG TPA: 3D domain-containing protein [Chloroflexota bacterium]|nr:3D domain-containing protein [Chloroflexota bacterium]